MKILIVFVPPSVGTNQSSIFGIAYVRHLVGGFSKSDFPEVAEGPDYGGHGAISDGDGEV